MSAQFDGITFDQALDGPRLSSQLMRVKAIMADGKFHKLGEVARRVGGSEAGVSARIRDLRKPKFGGFQVDRVRIDGGLWAYRLRAMEPTQLSLLERI